jgi:type I restriction enzyme S subunit
MNKLHKYPFNALYDISSGISTSKDQAGHGNPFVSFKTVFNNYFLPDELSDLMDSSPNDQVKYSVKKGDILVTRTSETVDELALSCVALKDYPKATFSGFLKRLRPKKSGIVYEKYIAFFLRSKYFRKVIDNNTIMTLRASFNEDIFSFLDLYLPEYKEQVTIGDLLYLIEHKIQINNKINDNLQQQLKLIYDYWFTQFDFPDSNGNPYRSSGGAMVWCSELQRDIPEGWRCVSLSDILKENTSAFDYKTEQPTIDLSVMPSSSIVLDQLNTSSMFSTNLFNMSEGDILFGSIRPYLKKAGIAPCDGVVAGTIHSYSVKKASDYNFALFTLCRDAFFDYAVQVSTGTKMPVINSDNILSFKVPYSETVAAKFNNYDVKSIICKNVQESLELVKLRDWLLPMLMNGQAIIAD